LPADVRDPHAHNAGLSTVGDHALALGGCESGLDQFDHNVDRQPVRTQDRLGVTVTAPRKQFEGAAPVKKQTRAVDIPSRTARHKQPIVPDFLHVSANSAKAVAVIVKTPAIIN